MDTLARENQMTSRYLELRQNVDTQAARLVDLHATHLECKRGCDYCCTPIAIHAAERLLILRTLRKHGFTPSPEHVGKKTDSSDIESCMFLRGGICTIYAFRPIICRVHGLQLDYPVYEYDSTGMRIPGNERITHWCDLNFTRLSPDENAKPGADGALQGTAIKSIPAEEKIDMGQIESELDMLDMMYLEMIGDQKESHLVELNDIFDD